jgi:hypothetical protein
VNEKKEDNGNKPQSFNREQRKHRQTRVYMNAEMLCVCVSVCVFVVCVTDSKTKMKERRYTEFLLEKFNILQIVLNRLILNIVKLILHLQYIIVQILIKTVKLM